MDPNASILRKLRSAPRQKHMQNISFPPRSPKQPKLPGVPEPDTPNRPIEPPGPDNLPVDAPLDEPQEDDEEN